MAQLVDIQKVEIGPENMVATVRIADGAPLMTSEDVEATARVYWLMPDIASHACYGDDGETFQDVMGATELAHLLEHMTLELMAQTNLAGDISCGRTEAAGDRTWKITLACPDDVLACGALSSAAWIMQWAFGGAPADQEPDVPAIVEGLVNLVSMAYGADDEAPAAEEDTPVEDEAEAVAVESMDGDTAESEVAVEEPEAPVNEPVDEPVVEEDGSVEERPEDVVQTIATQVGDDVVVTTEETRE